MPEITGSRKAGRKRRALLLASSILTLAPLWTPAGPAQAQDATWLANPGSGDFSDANNWSPASVPTGTAYFGATSTSSLAFSTGPTTIGGWTFNAGASNYTFTNNNQLYFNGAGIAVNGGSVTINSHNTLIFFNSSTAGSATINNYSDLQFFDTSSAGTATITNNDTLGFITSSTAGSATITNNSNLGFYDSATAGSATITNNNYLRFFGNSTAGNATLLNDGTVDFSNSTGPNGDGKLSAGSIAGGGNYILGANELTVGSNNLSTEVSGVISGSGSLVKTGTGTLILTGANTYTGGTTINGGTLQLGSAGAVGSILGTVTVGSSGAFNVVNADTSGITSIINGGLLNFRNTSTAGSATITNNYYMYVWDTSTAGSAIITNNQFLGFQNLSSAGTATITNNAGATIEFRDSSTAGSAAITVADGTLNFTNTSSAGSATINLSNVGSTTSYFRDTSTAANATINISSNDAIWFYNQSTAANATIVNNGTIGTWDNATLGDAHITNNRRIYFENTSSAGNATIVNNGTSIYFYHSSTAGTATITNNTSLNFWSDSSAGSAHITNAAAGTLEIVNSSTLANATVINNGQMNFWGANGGDISTAGNATITNNAGATMELRNYATTGNANIGNAGAMTFKNSSTAGSAAITNNTGGTIEFYDASTAGTASITNHNTLTFYSNTTAGSAVITNSGTVLFDGNSTAGSAQLINSGSSAVVNFWTPGPASDGRITAGSLAGSGRFDLNSVELTVGSNNLSTEVTGALTGDGLVTGTSLIKTGTGTLTLSGINTYTGATIVDGGTLSVNGSIAASSSLTMNSGTTLGGTGIVGATTIASGATLAPGNSIGTLTVNGNLTFNAGGFYTVEVSPTAADRTNVTGTATLTGATVQAVALAGSFRQQTYTILNATGGLGGTQFAGLTGSSFAPGARNPHLTYDANNVYLVLDPGTIQLPSGASGNQASVAGGINSAVLNGGTPPAAFDALLNMSGAQQTNSLNQVSGQPGTSSTQASFGANQQFMSMLDPASGRGGTGGVISFAEEDEALAYSARSAKAREAYAAVTPRDRRPTSVDRRWGVWATGYGGTSTVNGSTSSGTSTTTSRVYGTVVGADYRVAPETLIGFAFGGAGYSFSLSDGLGSGKADLFQAGLYGRHSFGAAYLSATLTYGWQDVTTDRTVTVSGVDKLTANYKAHTFAARTEAGWRFAPWPAAGVGITPYAALQVTSFHLPGYSETATSGSNTFALSYNAQTTTNWRTELGTHLDRPILVRDGLFTLKGRLAWAHDSNTDRPATATFQTLPGSTFTTNGAKPAADAALISAGAKMDWLNGFSLAGSFEGEFSSTTRSYAGKATLRYDW